MEEPTVYADYFDRYTALVSERSISEAFNNQDAILDAFMGKVSEEKAGYAYAPGKWTLKELLQHLVDCERIFAYRALAIARQDPADLPGFEENDYAANSMANNRTWASLTEEMKAVRTSTKLLFNSFTDEMMKATGTFNHKKGEVGKLGFIIVGHTNHHIKIGEERYLADPS